MTQSKIRWRELLQCFSGTSSIEFALIVPVVIGFLIGIADLGRGLAHKFRLEQANYRVFELIAAGSTQPNYITLVEEELEKTLVGHSVAVRQWRECDGVEKVPFAEPCTGTEQIARFVRVTITSNFKPIFPLGPFKNMVVGDDGQVPLRASTTARVQ